MNFPEQAFAHPLGGGGWPGNELEEAMSAAVGQPNAGPRLIEVLGRNAVWVPLPAGGSQQSTDLDLPTLELDGAPYVPVYSSEQQFLQCVGSHMSFAVAPAVEFARGLPPQLGIVVNPEGVVGMPLPPPAVAELCRTGRTALDGPASGARVRLFEPDWQEDPVDFLAVAAEEFEAIGVVLSARRALASIEGESPTLFIGVEFSTWDGAGRNAPMEALGRALGRVPVDWPVNLVLLDVTQDPVATWMRERVRPFYARAR